MIVSSTPKGSAQTSRSVRRVVIGAAGVAALGIALLRAPIWAEAWGTPVVVGLVTAAALVLVLTICVAVRGSARIVDRLTLEILFFGCALLAAEAILLARAPENWFENPALRRLVAQERAALAAGIAYDARLPAEVAADLRSQGVNAVPGFAEGVISSPAVSSAIAERGVLPLSNVANAVVVECNEGPGYMKFKSGPFGFNNPPNVASGPVDVAVIGESLALGHCVPPGTSTVDRLRDRFPRTANFGVAGSRVLSQLGVFREYVERLEPDILLWFVSMNYADPRHETSEPVLLRYLADPSFSQGLRSRQSEVDALVGEIAVPVAEQRDRALREGLDEPAGFPVDRWLKFREIRRVVGLLEATQPPPVQPDLTHFTQVTELIAATAERWGGRVIVVMLPSYEISAGEEQAVVRYDAVSRALEEAPVEVVDGPEVFASEPDFLALYTLRMDNHPSERGHALLAEAIIAAIKKGDKS